MDSTKEVNAELELSTGISVPSTYFQTESPLPCVVLGHGLGTTNPVEHNHLVDRWIKIAHDATVAENASVLSYTARGHGTSTGWEATAESNADQFTWRNLATDMLAAAEYYKVDRMVVGGDSMGSATSLYAAMQQPSKVSGIILIRPPTAWRERLDRRHILLSLADRLKERLAGLPADQQTSQMKAAHWVLRGTAYSDLPPVESDEYHGIAHIPTLILAVRNDPVHPIYTAEILHGLLPQSALHIAEDPTEALECWPELIRQFLRSLSK